MQSHTVYKHLQRRDRVLGLELTDLFAVLIVLGGLLMFTERLGLSALVAASAYAGLILLKRGKPPGWTGQWLKFQVSPKCYRGGAAGR